jgi:hypothetical protein
MAPAIKMYDNDDNNDDDGYHTCNSLHVQRTVCVCLCVCVCVCVRMCGNLFNELKDIKHG